MTEKVTNIPAIDIIGDSRCTGCAGCVNTCGEKALVMRLNPEGFYRPQVDRSLCTNCCACSQICPVLIEECGQLKKSQWKEPKAFAGWSHDDSIRIASSSGGIFTELAKECFKQGGIVVGCGWTEKWNASHIFVHYENELEKLRGSKYVQSSVGDVLTKTAKLCRNGELVLFSGTPCQIAAIQEILPPNSREFLITCEVICHGVPSVKLFHRYLNWLFNGDEVLEYYFRNKSLGWQTVWARSSFGQTIIKPLLADQYARLSFIYHLSLMEACYKCVFQKPPRLADISLGDFWGVPSELNDLKGVSLVLVNSPYGESLCQEAIKSRTIEMVPVELAVAVKKSPRATGTDYYPPLLRKAFLRDVARGYSFRDLLWKYYLPIRLTEQIRRFFSRLWKKVRKKWMSLKDEVMHMSI